MWRTNLQRKVQRKLNGQTKRENLSKRLNPKRAKRPQGKIKEESKLPND